MSDRSKRKCDQCGSMRNIEGNRPICWPCRSFNGRVKKGEIRPPDYKEVNVANYKEPMRKVEDGFGYYGAVTQTNDGEQIQCHICGFYFAEIGPHVVAKHKVPIRDYKIKYGLRIKEGLLSPVAKVRAQVKYNKYCRRSPAEMKQMSLKGAKVRKEKGIETGGDQWTPQTRNEKGLCKDQTIAKIRRIAEICGGTPLQATYQAEYGGMDVVYHWFGTWENAVAESGFESYLKDRKRKRKNRMKDVESMIAAFYEENKRTPQTSDFNSVEYLPGQREVSRLFGTLNNARAAAGVPILVYYKSKWVEVEPGQEVDGVVPSHNRGFMGWRKY